MHWKDTPMGYGVITKFFHWSIVLLILAQFVLGLTMGYYERGDATRQSLYFWHQSTGLLMFIVVIGRIIWRRFITLPDWAASLTPNDRKIAHWVERILYYLMVIVPLSGLISSMAEADYLPFFGLFSIPSPLPHSEFLAMNFGLLHAISRILIVIVILFHVGFILKHQFINKGRLLNRMLPFGRA